MLEGESNYSVTRKHIFLECCNLLHQERIPLMKYFFYPLSLGLFRDKRESTVRKTDRPALFQHSCTNIMEQQWIWQERKKPIFVCLPAWIILREEKSLFICPENPKESKQLLVPSPFLLIRHFVRFVFGHVPSANVQYIYLINTSNRCFFCGSSCWHSNFTMTAKFREQMPNNLFFAMIWNFRIPL